MSYQDLYCIQNHANLKEMESSVTRRLLKVLCMLSVSELCCRLSHCSSYGGFAQAHMSAIHLARVEL
jgi:hypothetical protein